MSLTNEDTGRLLGHLYNKIVHNLIDDLSDADLTQINQLEDQLQTLKNLNRWGKILKTFSNAQCATEDKIFRKIDTYLGIIFLGFRDLENSTENFFVHLNSCFYCFEEYSTIMREFVNTAEIDAEDES